MPWLKLASLFIMFSDCISLYPSLSTLDKARILHLCLDSGSSNDLISSLLIISFLLLLFLAILRLTCIWHLFFFYLAHCNNDFTARHYFEEKIFKCCPLQIDK